MVEPSDKYQNKYRIASARLPHWDYGSNGAYFVTICTHHRIHFFGDIQNGQMCLSEIGKNAQNYWQEIPQHFPFAILDAFVVMPNHIHGIIVIHKSIDTIHGNDHNPGGNGPRRDAINRVSAIGADIADGAGGITGNHNPMLHQNLSRMIRWYKGRVSFESRKTDPHFAWQSRFHDHVVRDERAHQRIATYILNNPLNWEQDRNYV